MDNQKHLDEIIVYIRNQQEKEVRKIHGNLNDGWLVNGNVYEFDSVLLFDNQVEVSLPKEFQLMPEDKLKEKYFAEQRPVVWTDSTYLINFTFCLTEERFVSEATNPCVQTLKDAIRSVYPATVFYNDGQIEENKRIVFFDFKSFSLNGPVYNMMYLTEIRGKVFIGTFNCPFDKYEDWELVVYKIMESLKEHTEGDLYESKSNYYGTF